ncbi:DUF397 domain-containing protein [Streptomyces sedi]|uniref:DUF397 domain-containing protein n=1 Tax=Streptomyces sedi TaxID=555059 RepID=A0A5C4V0F4_9ACTN|nr:DUF397 domain-containing protein [Streptomyces sedi]TNM29382.1 DUF397 domain-containing protein [Streptomyces sedi]
MRTFPAGQLNGWRKSTYSENGAGGCLEVVDGLADTVPVRDSKNPNGPAVLMPVAAWRALLDHVRR